MKRSNGQTPGGYPRAKRSYGQNFLIHRPTLETISQHAAQMDPKLIVELGTGTGSLTRHLAARVERVISLELDPDMVKWLDEQGELPENVELREADMLKLDIPGLYRELGHGPLSMVGNLPYNISTQMVFKLVEKADFLKGALLMFQKEVAERIAAPAGSKSYGILSVAAQYRADVRKLFDIPPTLFSPRPKVTSALVEFRFGPRPEGLVDEAAFFRVVKAAFSQRRKKLVNTLSAGLGLEKGVIRQAAEAAGIDPDVRPERLTVADFIMLTSKLLPKVKGDRTR